MSKLLSLIPKGQHIALLKVVAKYKVTVPRIQNIHLYSNKLKRQIKTKGKVLMTTKQPSEMQVNVTGEVKIGLGSLSLAERLLLVFATNHSVK